jgi:hypothetical protein
MKYFGGALAGSAVNIQDFVDPHQKNMFISRAVLLYGLLIVDVQHAP